MPNAATLDQDRLRRLVEEALPVARERAQLALDIRDALMRGDEISAITLMRRYVGLPPELRAS